MKRSSGWTRRRTNTLWYSVSESSTGSLSKEKGGEERERGHGEGWRVSGRVLPVLLVTGSAHLHSE